MIRCLIVLSLLFLSACSADISRYQINTPRLDPTQFFNGNLCAWGTVHDYSGEVSRRFIADITASSTSSSFILDELFLFDDGSTQTRVWTFTKNADGWTGQAHDVNGPAEAEFSGNMMSLIYELEITLDDDTINIAMDDKLHLIDENNLIGKTEMSKFGIQVGEINLLMQKQEQPGRCNLTMGVNS